MGYPLRWESLAVPAQPIPERPAVEDEEVASANAQRRYLRNLVFVTVAGSMILVLSVITITRLALTDMPAPALALASAPQGAAAIEGAPRIERHAGYVVVSGTLVNRTADPMERLEAVVDLLDSSYRTLSSENAMVDRDTIAPGETSGFRIAMADVPAAKAYRIHFKKLLGADVN